MKKDLISVIVPIYKVEKYLAKCIESIINQTYTYLEIILVDDGSPDNCGEICEEYAKEDKRIKVIHKENGGVSQARNTGLDNSNGEYVIFIDSDDYIENDMIYKLKENIKSNSMSICSYRKIFEDGRIEINKVSKRLTIREFKKSLFFNGKYQYGYQGFVCTKIFKNEIIQKNMIRFNETIMYNEDRLFLYEYLNKNNKEEYVNVFDYIGYNYLQRKDSVMNNEKYNKQMYTEFVAFDIMSKKAIEENEKDIADIIKAEYVIHAIDMYRKYNISIYREMIKKEISKVLFSRYVSVKAKLKILKRYREGKI